MLNHIYPQDCVIGMKTIPDNYVDMVIIDPPYGIEKDKEFNTNSFREFGDYIKWCKTWITESVRILKDTGTMFIYGFSENLAHISVNLPRDHQRWLIWHYTNKNVPSLNFWQRSHEAIICYWKDKPIFNRDLVRVPYTEAYLKNAAGKKRPASNSARFGNKETVYTANQFGALPRDVIEDIISVPSMAGGSSLKERGIYCKTCDKLIDPKDRANHENHEVIIHPTQKPLELTDKLIKSCRPKGQFVAVIPFCGSGSECLAVKNNNGSYIGFELNKDYIKLAEARLI